MLSGLVLALALCGPAAGEAAPEEDERAELTRFWSAVFAPPAPHDWEVSLAPGRQFWELAWGGYEREALYRMSVRRRLNDWLGATLLLDYSDLSSGTTSLRFDDRRVSAAAALGLLRWQGRFRLDAAVSFGPSWRTIEIGDGVGTRRTTGELDLAAGLELGAAVSLAGRAALGLRFGPRYVAGRLNYLLLVDVDWLFGWH